MMRDGDLFYCLTVSLYNMAKERANFFYRLMKTTE